MILRVAEEVPPTTSSLVPGVYYPKLYPRKNRRRSPRCVPERAVLKNGEFNVLKPTSLNRSTFIINWFVAMVQARWRWTLLNFVATFTADWLLFGFIYWIIALQHGDLETDHLPQYQNDTWVPCIENIYGFTSTFLFSVEIHTTLAYGKRSITLECPHAITAMCLQCILSSIFQAFMIGILFVKLTRPKSRTNTILFSKNAVINLRDDQLCLVFRVGDMRKARIFNIKAMAFIVRFEFECAKLETYDQMELEVELDGCESSFFLWPVSVIHVINESSPLHNVSAADLIDGKLEIVVVFEGVIESTGQPLQARSSFTEFEILWGHRFVPMVTFDDNKSIYNVDFSKLSVTEQVDTPLCSAKEFEDFVGNL